MIPPVYLAALEAALIKYRFHYQGVIPILVSLDVNDLDAIAPLVTEAEIPGTESFAEAALESLANLRGAFGHIVGRETSAQNLAAALGNQPNWQPQLLQGGEVLLHPWKLNIPEDAIH